MNRRKKFIPYPYGGEVTHRNELNTPRVVASPADFDETHFNRGSDKAEGRVLSLWGSMQEGEHRETHGR